jgi:hypothetical protein
MSASNFGHLESDSGHRRSGIRGIVRRRPDEVSEGDGKVVDVRDQGKTSLVLTIPFTFPDSNGQIPHKK